MVRREVGGSADGQLSAGDMYMYGRVNGPVYKRAAIHHFSRKQSSIDTFFDNASSQAFVQWWLCSMVSFDPNRLCPLKVVEKKGDNHERTQQESCGVQATSDCCDQPYEGAATHAHNPHKPVACSFSVSDSMYSRKLASLP